MLPGKAWLATMNPHCLTLEEFVGPMVHRIFKSVTSYVYEGMCMHMCTCTHTSSCRHKLPDEMVMDFLVFASLITRHQRNTVIPSRRHLELIHQVVVRILMVLL